MPLKLSLAVLLCLQTVLFWAFPYFPSQDGPAHLESAAALIGLSRGDDFYSSVYTSVLQFRSNQIYHGLLYLLGQAMPLLYAEKLILSSYGLALTGSIWYLIHSVRGTHHAILLALPVVFSHVLYMGFFNSSLALVAGVWSLGLYFELYNQWTWRRWVSLMLALILTYFLHVFVLFVVLFAMILMSIARLVAGSVYQAKGATNSDKAVLRRYWMTTFSWLLAAIPAAILAIWFLSTTNENSVGPSTPLLQKSVEIASFRGLKLITKAYHALVTFSLLDILIQLPWLILLVWAAICGFSTKLKKKMTVNSAVRSFNHSYLWAAWVAVLTLIVVLPINSGPIALTDSRFSPFFFVALVTWLSTNALSVQQWQRIANIAFIVVGAQLIYRIPAHASLNNDIQEYKQAQSFIPPRSTVLPLDTGPETHGYLSWGGQYLRFNHMWHAAGYLALDKPLINISNFVFRYPYFPIRFHPGVSAHFRSRLWTNTEFVFDLTAPELTTLPEIKTITLWGDISSTYNQKRLDSLASQLAQNGFVESYVSTTRALLHVYQRP